VVVQGNALNRSHIGSVVCVPLTSNLRLAEAPGNVVLWSRSTNLWRDSVCQRVSQIVTLDRSLLSEHVGSLAERNLMLVLAGIDLVLGR